MVASPVASLAEPCRPGELLGFGGGRALAPAKTMLASGPKGVLVARGLPLHLVVQHQIL